MVAEAQSNARDEMAIAQLEIDELRQKLKEAQTQKTEMT